MLRCVRYAVLPLILSAPCFAKVPLEEQLDRPFASFLDSSDTTRYSPKEFKSLRSHLEHERDLQTEACRNEAKRFRRQLDDARRELRTLNESASRDSPAAATRRAGLHVNVAALERVIHDKQECEQDLRSEFQIRLAKLSVIQRWPDRREAIIKDMQTGRGRNRRHGDIDDLGYRKLDGKDDPAAGERAVRQMAASGLMPQPIHDSDVEQYVSALTRRLAATSDLKTPLHATVLDSREISAIGLPGGFLFVTSGLVLAARDESELAGMMSRQIASIAAHHRLRASKRSILSRLLVPAAQITTGVFTGGVSNAGAYYGMNYGFQGLGALVDKTVAARDERFQKEADQLGIQYAWNAGFDPSGFIAFLDAIARERSQPGAAAFFGAPDLAARVLNAFSEIQHLPAKPILADDSVAFQSAKQRLQKSVENEE